MQIQVFVEHWYALLLAGVEIAIIHKLYRESNLKRRYFVYLRSDALHNMLIANT